ncbi:xanthine dehydrogenase family protein molybdopterin-binding subunit [Blastococcus saxobsidens]|uniref:CO/xanthine dehydrogenase Mo-binding subunit n=1 Tax=Blastococcus saxobsidens TaxID=138336 RepID=A0A4Q7Y2F2_9ACTN|nr:xanthine dehydrogenase family protein molybdopterin-binding subunit [Blastococcus saxobsidens]RZU30980.1 CO/xanthine dehydrogenase Mo-binding subunit [Blastococcus saxobsidens]
MIGQRQTLLDARDRVTGRIPYTINLEPPGTLHVAILRSTVPHARLVRVDASAASQLPGVAAVLTRDDFAGSSIRPLFGPVFRDQPIVAMDRVRYVGEPVAAVAATDLRAAEAALESIEVEYEELPAVFTPQDALAAGAPLLHESFDDRAPGYADIVLQGQGGNVCNKFQLRKGDGLAGFELADEIFEHEFSSPPVQHVSMEPHAAVASFEGDYLTVHTCTQTPYAVRDALAYMFRLPASHVRVVVPPVGGGFGGKTYAKVEPLAAVLSKMTHRPVKVHLTREEEFVTNRKHQAFIKLRTGMRRDGTIVAREVQALFNAGAYTDISPRLIKNGGYGAVGPYRISHVHIDSYAVFTNLPSAGAFRGYGVSQGSWAYESQMDMIAEAMGFDPIELRMRNLLLEGDTFATGETLHGIRFPEVLRDATTLFEAGRVPPPAEDDGSVKRGRGCAVIIKSTITPSTSAASVKLNSDGSLQVLTSTVDMGQGAHTALSQIAASALGVGVGSIGVVGPDTDVTPFDLTTSSSRSTAAMGAAVREAVFDVRRQLLDLAAQQMEVDVTDLELADGRISVVGDPASGRSIAEVVTASRRGTLAGNGSFVTEGGLHPETGQGIASEHWHQGAVAAEVDVDVATGKVTVRGLRASVYAGTVVNPINARMQIDGSVSFGISQALFEQLIHDEGHPANSSLSEYALAGLADLPEVFEVSLIEDPDNDEMHGLGETCLPPVMPAIANAVADAVGVRIRHLPLTAERVLDALEEQR